MRTRLPEKVAAATLEMEPGVWGGMTLRVAMELDRVDYQLPQEPAEEVALQQAVEVDSMQIGWVGDGVSPKSTKVANRATNKLIVGSGPSLGMKGGKAMVRPSATYEAQ